MPKVSIIVPVYNVEKFIGRCIESIQKQTLKEWELILVDDCSPDNSIDIINEYASKDDRIIVKRHDCNHGPMIARRWGDKISSGEYITYCDGDDTLPENALMSLYSAAKKTNSDMVIGGFSVVAVNGKRNVVSLLNKKIVDGDELLKALLRCTALQTLWCKLFKADVIKGHDYKVIDHMTNGEDAYLLYQMIPYIHTVVNIDDVVYNYIQNCESSSNRRYSEQALENIVFVNAYRVSMIEKYPQMKKDILCLVSNVLNILFIKGYNKDGILQALLERYHLQDYVSDKLIISTHSLWSAAILLVRKYFLRR